MALKTITLEGDLSQGYKVQHREYSNILITMYGVRWVLDLLG